MAALQKKFPKHWPVFLFLIVILLSFFFFFVRFLSELSFLGPHSVKHLAASFVSFFMQKKMEDHGHLIILQMFEIYLLHWHSFVFLVEEQAAAEMGFGFVTC